MNESTVRISLPLLLLLLSLPLLAETIYTPSLPDLASFFGVKNSLAEFTISIYLIGFAFGILFWGRVSDFIGRKPAMLYGLVIYILSCAGCIMSNEIMYLLISRFIQAFGASTGSVISQTMLRDVLDDKKRGKIFSIIGMVMSVSPAIGPLIGSYSSSYYGWVSTFYILLFYGIVLLISSFIYLPETMKPKQKQHPAASFFSTAKRLFQDKMVMGLCCIIGIVNGIMFSFYAEAPFIFINLLKLPAKHYGLIGLISIAFIIGSEISRRLNHSRNPKIIIKLGCWIISFGATILALVGNFGMIEYSKGNLAYLAAILPMFIIFIGISVTIPNCLSIALDNYKHVLGTAGSIFGFSYYVIISLVTFIMGKIHNGTSIPMVSYFLILAISMIIVYYYAINNTKENMHVLQSRQ